MLAKICFLILCMGAVACTVLGYRQTRLQTLHELSDVQRRLMAHDRDLFRLRAEIAAQVTPSRIAKLSSRLGPLVSIGVDDEMVSPINPLGHSTRISGAIVADGDERQSPRR